MDKGKLYLTPKGFVVERVGEYNNEIIIKCWNSDKPELGAFTAVPLDGEYIRSLEPLSRERLKAFTRHATVMHEYHGKAKIRFQEELHKRGKR